MADESLEPHGTLGETAFANRSLPTRESPYEVGANLLAAVAITFALAALVGALAHAAGLVQLTTLVSRPFKPGFIAMAFAIVALAISGQRTRFARMALVLATLCWLAGGIIAVLADAPIF